MYKGQILEPLSLMDSDEVTAQLFDTNRLLVLLEPKLAGIQSEFVSNLIGKKMQEWEGCEPDPSDPSLLYSIFASTFCLFRLIGSRPDFHHQAQQLEQHLLGQVQEHKKLQLLIIDQLRSLNNPEEDEEEVGEMEVNHALLIKILTLQNPAFEQYSGMVTQKILEFKT